MSNEYDISRAFKRIENDLIDSMMRNLKRHRAEEDELGIQWEQWQALQIKELERYQYENANKFTEDFDDIDTRIMELFYGTYSDAQTKEEAKILDKIISDDYTPVQTGDTTFFNLNDDKLNILLERTKADFKRAEYAVLRKADDEYRRVIFDAQVYANITNDYNKAVDMATHDFLKNGLQSIQYKNGARHNISDYARMAIRTGNKRAYLMGEGNARSKYGIHTVRVNRRTQACPLCVGYLGKVLVDDVYGGGTAKEASDLGVPTLSSAMQAGFLHPNCKDIYSLYIEGISKPADPWTQDEIKKIVGDYNQEQALQHAEDMAESYWRMSKYALDPDNKARYGARAFKWEVRADEIRAGNVVPLVAKPATKQVVKQVAQSLAEEDEIRKEIRKSKQQITVVTTDQARREADLKALIDAHVYYNTRLKHDFQKQADRTKQEVLDLIKDELKQPYYYYADEAKYVRDNIDVFMDGSVIDKSAEIEKDIKALKKKVKKLQADMDKQYDDLEKVIGEPNVSKLSVYKEKNTKAIKRFLDDAPEEYRKAWNNCADRFNPLGSSDRWGRRRTGAYYTADEDGVWLSINKASKGCDYQTPFQVVFHEYGHNIDYVFNKLYGDGTVTAFTETYKGGAFGKKVMEEADNAIMKFMKSKGITDRAKGEKEFCKFMKNKYSLMQRTDISDMFESSMNINYPFGVGHGKDKYGQRYWDDYGKDKRWIRTGREAFAEMYSAMIANPESWDTINEYFPESVIIFDEILKVAQ